MTCILATNDVERSTVTSSYLYYSGAQSSRRQSLVFAIYLFLLARSVVSTTDLQVSESAWLLSTILSIIISIYAWSIPICARACVIIVADITAQPVIKLILYIIHMAAPLNYVI